MSPFYREKENPRPREVVWLAPDDEGHQEEGLGFGAWFLQLGSPRMAFLLQGKAFLFHKMGQHALLSRTHPVLLGVGCGNGMSGPCHVLTHERCSEQGSRHRWVLLGVTCCCCCSQLPLSSRPTEHTLIQGKLTVNPPSCTEYRSNLHITAQHGGMPGRLGEDKLNF